MAKNRISFGDEYWVYNEKNRKKMWKSRPLSYFRGLKKKKILEVGSGYGIFLYCLAGKNDVYGIDIDSERVEASKINLEMQGVKADVRQGDARKLPYGDGVFDAVFCHGVIEHFDGSEKAIEEGYRVLKEKGVAMYSVPAKISFFTPLKITQQAIDKMFGTNLWQCGYEKSFTTWKFKKMLKDKGFKILKFEISNHEPGRRFPIIGKVLRILDMPFYKTGMGGRFLFALCKKE